MAYTKNIWDIFNPDIPEEQQPDAFLTKKKLDNIETGIETAHQLIEQVKTGEQGPQGEPGPQGEQGPQGEKGEPGENGYTPEKGVDYFTKEDKEEIINDILATQKNKPYYDEELGKFFACGVHVNVYAAEEAGKLRITWFEGEKELIVPENIDIYGGGASEDVVVYYPATSVTLNSGVIDSIIGGCLGNGSVGKSTIVINGGKANYVAGAGMHWADKNAHNNIVGTSHIILNDAERVEYVTGGTPSGLCTVGTIKIECFGGDYGLLMAGGVNGYTSTGEIEINGGTFRSVQAGNRGTLGNVKITVNGGTITNAVYGGVGDTATYIRSRLILNGGNINKVAAGKYAGVDDTTAERISGTYVDGVVDDAQAEALHLVKVG